MRYIPQGTALEINNHANAGNPPLSTNLFDRLRPELRPAAVSPLTVAPPPIAKPANPLASGPDKTTDKTNDRTSATGGAVRPAPLPGLRSLLNSLFGSQN
jgi:hypothetical protein